MSQPESQTGTPLIANDSARLFLISFLVLFFELVCIRWIPAYIRYLSYFSNFVLLSCFLGMGVGLLAAKKKWQLFSLFPHTLLSFIILVSFMKYDFMLTSNDALYFQHHAKEYKQVESYYLLPFVFVSVTFMMAMLSQEMGQLFGRFRPLKAYALNIGASLAGIAIFSILSYFLASPLLWFLIISVIVLLLERGKPLKILFTLSALSLICISVFCLQKESIWSPYYKITMRELADGGKELNVNNIGHQTMQRIESKEAFYHIPYTSYNNNHFKRALIIGAGSGTDTSFALKYGVEQVTAVEIDPVIYMLGYHFHPLQPYSDSRTEVRICDARTFLKNDKSLYDLIIFALPDSLTLTSSFANLRLESYLFTVESLASAKERLAPGGLMVLYNYYREDWLIDKLAGMLREVFGYAPKVQVFESKEAVFMAGDKIKDLKSPIPDKKMDSSLKLATDDWPFIYMKRAAIPPIFIFSLLMIAAFGVGMVLLASPPGTLRGFSGHFFFLGAAFMLLETMNVVRFSLIFGSTWMVNSLVFFAVLAMVLLAIWVSERFRIERMWLLYAVLFGILLLNYLLPLESLLSGNPVLRYILSSLMLFSPIFFANLIFTSTFREETGTAVVALASNILGSFFGGMFEYTSLVLGYRNLVIFVAVFYAASFLFLHLAAKSKSH
ncbi:MAG: hypothetical protein RDV48_10095 [Candidatus Eremiobacteraeota bacterium]|nr:hypothetical protein [Candidatus Eremiobacteraeota bacterium]